MRGAKSRRGGSNTILFAHTARSAICHPPNTRNHWLQHAAANEREAEFSRSKWSNEEARHSSTQDSTPEWMKEGAQLTTSLQCKPASTRCEEIRCIGG